MSLIYYPKGDLMLRRDTVSASYEQIVLATSPNTILYFDTGSGLNEFSASTFYMTASRALVADTASYAFTAESASWAPPIPSVSASYADTASFASYAPTNPLPMQASASWASSSLSASYAPTNPLPATVSASYASASFSASHANVSDYVNNPPTIASASWASQSFNATSASYVPNLYPQTVQVSASWASASLSASYAPTNPHPLQVSASWASASLNADSASWALTAKELRESLIDNHFFITGQDGIHAAWSSSVAIIAPRFIGTADTASYVPNLYPQQVQISASWASASLSSSYVPNLYPQQVQVSASWSSASLSSSYVPNLYPQVIQTTVASSSWVSASAKITTADTASYVSAASVVGTVSSASVAVSASYAPPSTDIDTYAISASWVSASVFITTAQTASYVLNAVSASRAISAETSSFLTRNRTYEVTASWAVTSSYAQTWDSSSLITFVENLLQSSTYYLTATASLNGFYVMRQTGSGATVGTVSSASIPDQGYPFAWLTPANDPSVTVLNSGLYQPDFVARYTAGGGTITLTPELYLTNASGVIYYQIAAGNVSSLSTTMTRFQPNIIIDAPVTMSATDRLGLRLKAGVSAGTKTFECQVEGNVLSHLATPVSNITTNVTSASYALNASNAVSASYAPSNALPSQIAVTGLTASVAVIAPSHQFTQSFYIDRSIPSYTISNADNGLLVTFTGSVSQTVTVTTSSIDPAWSAMFYQSGSGKILFATASNSVLLRNRSSQSGSAGQYAICNVIRDASGAFILCGDTA